MLKSSIHIPELDAPSPSDTEQNASAEENALEGLRDEIRIEVHYHVKVLLKFGMYCLIAVLFIRLWHLIGPYRCRWLQPDDISSLDKMLFSSAFGGAALNYIKSLMLPGQKSD